MTTFGETFCKTCVEMMLGHAADDVRQVFCCGMTIYARRVGC